MMKNHALLLSLFNFFVALEGSAESLTEAFFIVEVSAKLNAKSFHFLANKFISNPVEVPSGMDGVGE